jgi:hypothetical protein
MALQIKRGSELEIDGITPLEGEPVWITDTKKLRVGDGSTQGGINVDSAAISNQALFTTSSVSFAGMTLTNIATLSTSSVRFNWPGNTNYYILQLEDYGIRLTQGSVYGPNDSDTQIITGGGTPSSANERNAAVVLKNGPTSIANFNTSTFAIYRNGQQSLYSNTLGTLTLGNGSGATNIASSSDTDLSLGSPQNTHNILLSTTEAKIRGKNTVEIITMTTSTTEFKAGGTTQASVRTTGLHIDNGYINGSGNGIVVQNYNGQPLEFKDNTSGNLKTLASFTTSSVTFDTVSSVRPQSNNTIDLGVAGTSWKTVYAKNIADSTQIAIGVNDGTTSTSMNFDNDSVQIYVNDGGGAWSTLYVDRFSSKLLTENNYGIDINDVPGKIDVKGKVLPSADNTYDLGDASYRWRNLYVSGEITANKLTIQYTTVTTTIVETDDIIKTTNATAATSGAGAIVATGGVSANTLFIDTTATITYTNIATEGQLRSQSTSWPFGENTATIMTIDTTVYGSARLNILVGADFGFDSHREKITLDILTNGVDVLNAQSGLLSTTSTGLCSYTAELSGTDILVKAVALDPVNFLNFSAKTIAELVVKPAGGGL